jgi:hypothetical protein
VSSRRKRKSPHKNPAGSNISAVSAMGMIRHQQYLDHFKQLLANPEKHITDLSLNCDETTTNERHFHILQPIVARRQTDDLAHFLNFLEEHGLN